MIIPPFNDALYDTILDACLLVVGIVCAVAFVYRTWREPRRMSCGVLLIMAIYLTVTSTLELLWPNTLLPDGDLAIGTGSEIMFTFFLLFLLLSFFGGIVLGINGIRLLRRERASLTHILPLAFGTVATLWPIAFILLISASANSGVTAFFNRVMTLIILYIPVMLFAVLLYSFVYAALPKPKTCDYIVVLGAGLRDGQTVTPLLAGRLDRAIRLYEKGGKRSFFVVSGGQGRDEKVSEAAAMRQYLLEQGIDEGQIILEDRSTSTAENIRFSKEIMDRRQKDYVSMLVTSNYHVLRAVILAKNIGLNAQGTGGKTALYYLPAAFIREYIAVIFEYRKLALVYVAAVIAFNLLDLLPGAIIG